MPPPAHLPHTGGMETSKAIHKFKCAADTGFNVLGPAKTVARSMRLIRRLRTKHGLNWRDIAKLFNAAMRDLGGSEASATTLCRLYNLERNRIKLKGGVVTEPSGTDAASPAAILARVSEPRGHPAALGSRVRDGPRPDIDSPTTISASALPSTREIMAEARDITAFKNQAKRKT